MIVILPLWYEKCKGISYIVLTKITLFKALESRNDYKTRCAKSVCLFGIYIRSYLQGTLSFYCVSTFLYACKGRTTRCKRLAYGHKAS